MKWFIRMFIGGGLVFFGGMSLLALYAEFGLPWKYAQKQQVMETYLEEKYKDTFTFERMDYDLMHGRNYYTYATAASTGVTFYVEVSPENAVEDAYSYEYWNGQVKDLFTPILKPTLQQYESLYGEVFLRKAMDLQTFDVDAASFALYVTMGMFLSEENVAEQCARWFEVIEAIRTAGYSVQQLTIQYYEKDIRLHEQELNQIQSAEQLRPFLIRQNKSTNSVSF